MHHAPHTLSMNRKLRIKCILHASTALTQKRDECSITYLNRGQQYAIHLQDTQGYEGTITSTIAITFHDPGHRNAAANYWKFWIGQQRDPQHARAIDLVDQSQGIVNVRYTSFDRISFDWQGSRGATVQTRFNCLSTDFSRIKGVKGIPLRIHLESTVTCSAEEAIDTPFARCSSGSFRPLRLDASSSAEDKWSYNESCFCKIKLFRDKGAERKNKDDAKHIAKQFEKAHCDSSDPLDHPMWKLYKRPVPYTVFGEIPQPSTTYTALDTSYAFPQALMGQKNHTRTMTAPSTFSLQSDFWHLSMPPQPSTPRHMTPSTATVCSAMMPHPFSSHDTPLFTNPHGQQEPAHIIEDTPIVKSNGIKRSRDHEDEGFICSPSKKKQNLGTGNSSQSVTVSLIFHCRTAEDLSLPSSPEPVVLDENRQHQSVFLKDKSVDELKRKVCETLALQVDHVSQILWRRKNKQQGDGSKNGNKNEYFVLVDDEIIARHVRDKTTAAATWDIRSDGRVRLILEMSP
ncbi:CP2 transcription factor-domain-containing protein [Syncephalastrum racemosum]|uniref:CP2 transcription factor-domain-containing protein n=1 Tax=Syncephalastrum racemosum TaxID=13706 RepID=A0A1X2HVL6_SYNRA|nr:CP2 transcription factor-domain-containing protein [Syncephalastrum racemosum]